MFELYKNLPVSPFFSNVKRCFLDDKNEDLLSYRRLYD